MEIYVILEGFVKRQTTHIVPNRRGLTFNEEISYQRSLSEASLGANEVIGLNLVDDRTRFPSDSTFTCLSPEVKCLIIHATEYKQALKKF